MKYMIMMNCPANGYELFMSWPKETLEAHVAFMHAFGEKLQKNGEHVLAEGLASPRQAKAVRLGKNGKPVTDGVFPETKEFLAGFWIVDVDKPERALELAGEVLNAPHVDVMSNGKPFEMVVEVREVMDSHECIE
jgi:hypothetical protein